MKAILQIVLSNIVYAGVVYLIDSLKYLLRETANKQSI